MKNYVVGLGEVGSALTEVLECDGQDIAPINPPPIRPDILHVAYPWSEHFVTTTRDYEHLFEPGLVVVHSTVPVGTCDPNGWVHSPVRGRHPTLAESLHVFTKQFGGARAWEAAETWPGQVYVADTAADTEAAKLWELIQFGVQVRVTQAIYEWCEQNGVDPQVVYRDSAVIYNTGYSKLGDDRFIRPVLDHVPGPVGGHCVTENARHIDHPLAELI